MEPNHLLPILNELEALFGGDIDHINEHPPKHFFQFKDEHKGEGLFEVMHAWFFSLKDSLQHGGSLTQSMRQAVSAARSELPFASQETFERIVRLSALFMMERQFIRGLHFSSTKTSKSTLIVECCSVVEALEGALSVKRTTIDVNVFSELCLLTNHSQVLANAQQFETQRYLAHWLVSLQNSPNQQPYAFLFEAMQQTERQFYHSNSLDSESAGRTIRTHALALWFAYVLRQFLERQFSSRSTIVQGKIEPIFAVFHLATQLSLLVQVPVPAVYFQPKREVSMSTLEKSDRSQLLKSLQVDATEAAWRTAGSQFVKLAKEPLIGMLTRHLGPNDPAVRARIAQFIETEIGTAMLAGLLSIGLGALPKTMGAIPEKLSRELRIRAMADITDVVAEVLMGPLRQVISLYLQGASDPILTNGFSVSSAEKSPQAETVA